MHHYTKNIYYHDTDCGDVVYYANYLKYLEEARTEVLREKGISLKELSASGVWFVVKNVDIEYKMPAKYADVLDITSEITKQKNVTLEFYQEVKRAEEVLVTAKATLVCVNSSFKPHPIPKGVENLLKK